jgi:hypothetical protein
VPRKGSATPRATAAATGKPAATPSWATDVPVTATVSPACVRPGQKATLKVRTKANAAIAYGAKYADGEYGAAPPFGKGYGGSGHDTADDGGRYETSWTVSANAPGGAATVDVVVGWQGDGGSTHPSFTVAGLDGNC